MELAIIIIFLCVMIVDYVDYFVIHARFITLRIYYKIDLPFYIFLIRIYLFAADSLMITSTTRCRSSSVRLG
jgi:hypothetical protein